MLSTDYNKYLAAIKAANDTANTELLRKIQGELLTKYEIGDKDVEYLIHQFRYHV